MANFFDRVLQINDWQTDGGPIDASTFLPMWLQLYAADLVTIAAAAAYFECNPAQGAGLTEVFETRPANITARQSWAIRVSSILLAGQSQIAGFFSEAEQRNHLGLDPLLPLLGGRVRR